MEASDRQFTDTAGPVRKNCARAQRGKTFAPSKQRLPLMLFWPLQAAAGFGIRFPPGEPSHWTAQNGRRKPGPDYGCPVPDAMRCDAMRCPALRKMGTSTYTDIHSACPAK
ncbi:hypothetical protein V2G26_008285 [Clonostachys chloroleuca]